MTGVWRLGRIATLAGLRALVSLLVGLALRL